MRPEIASDWLGPLQQHPLLIGFTLPRLRTRIAFKSADEVGIGEIEGNTHMIDDLILRVLR